MSSEAPIYIALGANLGKPEGSFRGAISLLSHRSVEIVKISGLWQSPAWPPGSGQPDYINACARVKFSGSARQLLAILHDIEAQMGRVRAELNAARTLDLDLIDFRGEIIDASDIEIPHPRMMTRGFVLFPLTQIAPDWRDPKTNVSIEAAIAMLPLADVAPMSYSGQFTL